MSDIIRLLPDTVANQIAAGEVIQRPSSVIKELVENSIDAGATLVQVVVLDAGKSCVQVIDNGKGMSETDARMAFERHATSKITEAADLFTLRTMGFRGEALASIAAVAQVELRTRMADQELGVSLMIEGGKVKEQTPISCPVGANFLVRNLFFNIPARRKFLKSNQTELSNILSELERIALAHPEVAFTLHAGEHLMLNLSIGNFKQRIVGIFGKKMDAHLVPLKVETTIVDISGYVGTPQSARKKGAQQYFFVNGRYMRHPYFNKAVQAAYERLVADGEQAPYFICFQIDPAKIDVNIHPQKTEIKFQDEPSIWPILLAAVREALGKSNAAPSIDFDTENRPEIPVFQSQNLPLNPPTIEVDPTYNPFETKSSRAVSAPRSTVPRTPHSDWEKLYDDLLNSPSDEGDSFGNPVDSPILFKEPLSSNTEGWTKESSRHFQILGRFIVAFSSLGILIVDQHRAHNRVLYEQYRKQLREQRGISQGLLFPQLIQFPTSASVVFEEMMADLEYLGFELSPLGEGAFSILGIPSGTEGLDPVELLQSITDDIVEGQIRIKEQIHHHIAQSLSRKAAIPVGQVICENEVNDLMERLFQCEQPKFTPDGKKVYNLMSNEKIEHLFN